MVFKVKNVMLVGLSAILFGSAFYSIPIQANEESEVEASVVNSDGVSARYLESIGIDINSDVYYITDSQMELVLREIGYDIPLTEDFYTTSFEGVTIVEKVDRGSWNIYVSRSFIKKYYYSGAFLADALAAVVLGLGAELAGYLSVTAAVIAGETDLGVYFKISNWQVVESGPQ